MWQINPLDIQIITGKLNYTSSIFSPLTGLMLLGYFPCRHCRPGIVMLSFSFIAFSLCFFRNTYAIDRFRDKGDERKKLFQTISEPVHEWKNMAATPVPPELIPVGPSTVHGQRSIEPQSELNDHNSDRVNGMVKERGPENPATPEENSEAEALKMKEELYLKDMQRGTIFEMDDAPDDVLVEAGESLTMNGNSPLDATPQVSEKATVDERATSASSMASFGKTGSDKNLPEAGLSWEAQGADENGNDLLVTAMRAGARPGANVDAIRSVVSAASAVARQGIAAVERQTGVGAGAIASPAVLNMPRPSLSILRVVFVAFKRIGAMNVDFNLPISQGDRFGSAVAVVLPIGDLDHNPRTLEIVVGASGDHTYKKKQGAVYILSLSNSGATLSNYHKVIPGEGNLAGQAHSYAGFGTAVASLGDLNNDGYADIAVGTPFQEGTGVVYILFLTFGGAVAKFMKLGGKKNEGGTWGNPYFGSPPYPAPLSVGDEFGCSVANIGDVNGDGVPDLAVGACGDMDTKSGWSSSKRGHETCTAAGAVYILFMNVDGTVKYHRKISARSGNLLLGPEPGDRFGASVGLIARRNGGAVIAVGAPFANGAGAQVGAVYMLELLATGDVKRFQILSSAYTPPSPGSSYSQYLYLSAPLSSHDYLGSAVASMDVDRDGVVDLLVGSRGYNQRAQDEGATFACYLDGFRGDLAGWEQVASQSGILLPVQPGEQFGASIAVFDDHTIDQASLLFIGAPGGCMDSVGGAVYGLRVQPIGG